VSVPFKYEVEHVTLSTVVILASESSVAVPLPLVFKPEYELLDGAVTDPEMVMDFEPLVL
jgi:hypothetical protein